MDLGRLSMQTLTVNNRKVSAIVDRKGIICYITPSNLLITKLVAYPKFGWDLMNSDREPVYLNYESLKHDTDKEDLVLPIFIIPKDFQRISRRYKTIVRLFYKRITDNYSQVITLFIFKKNYSSYTGYSKYADEILFLEL